MFSPKFRGNDSQFGTCEKQSHLVRINMVVGPGPTYRRGEIIPINGFIKNGAYRSSKPIYKLIRAPPCSQVISSQAVAKT